MKGHQLKLKDIEIKKEKSGLIRIKGYLGYACLHSEGYDLPTTKMGARRVLERDYAGYLSGRGKGKRK